MQYKLIQIIISSFDLSCVIQTQANFTSFEFEMNYELIRLYQLKHGAD